MKYLGREKSEQAGMQNVIVIGENAAQTERATNALISFFRLIDRKLNITRFSSYIDILNSDLPDRTLVISSESALQNQSDLQYLKALKNKFRTATIVHAYQKFAPIHMDDMIIKATNKFVKEDVLFEQNLEKSLSILFARKPKN